MVTRGPTLYSADKGEETTSPRLELDYARRLGIPILRLNHVLLAPWIIFSIPPVAVLQQQLGVAIVIAGVGFAGMLLRNMRIASLASVSLLSLIVWGKVAEDLYGGPAPDTALLILQFMFILFLMEASTVTIAFDTVYAEIGSKQDELSQTARLRLSKWVRVQLSSLSKLTLTAIGLSLGLLVLGGVASISVNQLGVSAVLVIASVVAILYLLTNRREPETSRRR